MTGAEFLVDHLVKLGVTDVFGIPGGVVLDFLYELDGRDDISAHLSFHEQCAGFAASGFAQLSGMLCVAYATKGPGITNLLTPVADAYSDGSPVLIVTAHSEKNIDKKVRFTGEQELDTVDIFKSVTKYAIRIDSTAVFPFEVKKACNIALEGRKGPVLIDVFSNIFSENVTVIKSLENVISFEQVTSSDYIIERLKTSRRPVFLIGDGIHQSGAESKMRELAKKANIGKTVLVTGATELIGSNIVDKLMLMGKVEVIALARNKDKLEKGFSDYIDSENFIAVVQDICAPIILLKDVKVDYIFMLPEQ